ncbi:cysteine desulfurase family protein [Paenibacillus graminis]|uniref:cysteine desulfurase family protein n=1 Tax=Paenibacillus graminis TaxID=189425 RepID=UPI000470F954|nr:cysteine desulfurase family protein [Paenibacillus graminis]
MDKKKIYFDCAATAPIHPEILKVFQAATENFNMNANPSSTHFFGMEANQRLELSRKIIGESLKVSPIEIIFTSGATESNNMAIFGYINHFRKQHIGLLHVITTEIEHPSVLNCYKRLETEGVSVSYLKTNPDGLVDVKHLVGLIQPNTVLVSIMHVNNETGAIQPVAEIGEMLKTNYPDICFHVDGVQGLGKVDLSLANIDLYVISGHKIGAPKGVGVLVKKEAISIEPLLYGGGQEMELRSGTINVPIIWALAKAIELSIFRMQERKDILQQNYSYLLSRLKGIDGIVINSPLAPYGAPHIMNISVPNVSSALLLNLLERKGICASSQSACSSTSVKASRILSAMGKTTAISGSSIRVSYNETYDLECMDRLISALVSVLEELDSAGVKRCLNDYENSLEKPTYV